MATVPAAPSAPVVLDVTQTTARVAFKPGSDGGATILGWELAYSRFRGEKEQTVGSPTTRLVTDLDPGKTYYFWARGRNSVGWGPWSEMSAGAELIAGALVKVGLVYKRAVPYVKINGVWRVAQPSVRIAGEWRETQ